VPALPLTPNNALRLYVAVFAALLLLCYGKTVASTAQILYRSDDMAHAFFAPAIAAYAIWGRRRNWPSSSEIRQDIWGLAPLFCGAALGIIGTLGSSSTLLRLALFVSLIGCIALVVGRAVLRVLAFPLILLLFMFPIPSPIYAKLTLPLQLLASRGAEAAFHLLGVAAVRSGNLIDMPSQRLEVAEACSGIRSLVTLAFFCLVYSYWNERRSWVRAILVLAAIPSSVFMNIIRITATGLIGEWNHTYTQGVWHETLGYLALVAGFGCVCGIHIALSRVFSRQVSDV
jgi:exosortase